MQLCMCFHRLTPRSGGMRYLFLQLPDRPFLGLVREADSPPIWFTPALWRICLLTIFFLQVVFLAPWSLD